MSCKEMRGNKGIFFGEKWILNMHMFMYNGLQHTIDNRIKL